VLERNRNAIEILRKFSMGNANLPYFTISMQMGIAGSIHVQIVHIHTHAWPYTVRTLQYRV
jgi:hypothetical protein